MDFQISSDEMFLIIGQLYVENKLQERVIQQLQESPLASSEKEDTNNKATSTRSRKRQS